MNNVLANTLALLLAATGTVLAQLPEVSVTESAVPDRGDQMLARYFEAETAKLEAACLTETGSKQQWETQRKTYLAQLHQMLGIEGIPRDTPLHATVTGRVEEAEFYVEKLHFQSRPGLYVTGNVYVPKASKGKMPAILYVCGHGRVKKDGVSYGNKVHYQHHGAWFARNGYVCLTIDSLQLGEIESIHHGTYRYDMWWWLNRGYTPAGVEAWNCIRALDYLQSRSDVDADRLGVTGRSGGGAYSWWIAALDERIKVAVPVAGITDLRNHVVDGCVEGHCDCMYFVNTFQWDYPMLAAMVAPRPLLISNTDNDRIFPLDGVVRTYNKVRGVYQRFGKTGDVGLHITSGPHKDTQELRVHAFRWFNRYLKDDESLIETSARPFFTPEQLKVFDKLPEDEINTKIHESFVVRSPLKKPATTKESVMTQKGEIVRFLGDRSFRAWPRDEPAAKADLLREEKASGVVCRRYTFQSQQQIDLDLFVVQSAEVDQPKLAVLNVLDEASWNEFLSIYGEKFKNVLPPTKLPAADATGWEQTRAMLTSQPWSMVYVAPRGVGPTAWNPDPRKRVQIRRRFYLLGQSLDGMRVWDVCRAVQATRSLEGLDGSRLWMQGHRQMGGIALVAALFEKDVERLDLYQLPTTLRKGPTLLNASRELDMASLVNAAMLEATVVVYDQDSDAWPAAQALSDQMDQRPARFQLRKPPAD